MWIYCIKNKLDGKRYIGQTIKTSVNDRWSAHIGDLERNRHFNSYLQNAWNKYKKDSFEFLILQENIQSIDELNELEIKYIKEYKSLDRKFGYNLREGGSKTTFTPDAIVRMSKAQTKRYSKKSERNKMSKIALKRFSDPEERKKAGIRNSKNWYNYTEKMSKNFDIARLKSILVTQKTYDGFINPDGIVFSPVINLTKFAREHKLTRQSLYRVYTNQLNHHKGWTKYNKEERI